MQQVVEVMDAAFNSLDEYQREIVNTKYGWRWVNGILELPPSHKTLETFKILEAQGFSRGEATFYRNLCEIRETVKAYINGLDPSILKQVSGMMPGKAKKVRKISDDEFGKVKSFLKLDDSKKIGV
jgi:hypothetical protein